MKTVYLVRLKGETKYASYSYADAVSYLHRLYITSGFRARIEQTLVNPATFN